jgi:hypothetical protein
MEPAANSELVGGDAQWCLAEPLREFLCECIQSHDRLEVLRRTEASPARWWSAGDLAREIHLSERVVQEAVDLLVAQQLLTRSPDGTAFGYRLSAAGQHHLVKEALAAYGDHPAEIARLLTSRAVTRARLSLQWLTDRLLA